MLELSAREALVEMPSERIIGAAMLQVDAMPTISHVSTIRHAPFF